MEILLFLYLPKVAFHRLLLAALLDGDRPSPQGTHADAIASYRFGFRFSDCALQIGAPVIFLFLRLRMPKFDEHLALHRADCLSSHGKLEMYDYAKEHLEELGEEQIRPKLLLTGSDLIAAGYRPGPGFKAMLEAAEDAQLEGSVKTKKQALRMVREMFPG